MNKSNIMNLNNFSDFKFTEESYCDYKIFDEYPNSSLVIVINNRCLIYSKDKKREKYEDINKLKEEKGLLNNNSIISTENGQYIKNQYEQLTGLKVSDILIFDKKNKKYDSFGGLY